MVTEIRLKEFGYTNSTKSFRRLRSGQVPRVVVFSPSGSGKSSLCHLFLRWIKILRRCQKEGWKTKAGSMRSSQLRGRQADNDRLKHIPWRISTHATRASRTIPLLDKSEPRRRTWVAMLGSMFTYALLRKLVQMPPLRPRFLSEVFFCKQNSKEFRLQSFRQRKQCPNSGVSRRIFL